MFKGSVYCTNNQIKVYTKGVEKNQAFQTFFSQALLLPDHSEIHISVFRTLLMIGLMIGFCHPCSE